jgi:hypothetical protein
LAALFFIRLHWFNKEEWHVSEMQLLTAGCLSFWVYCVQERLVANKDVTQLVAMLSNPLERLPAMLDYLHEHLQGAEHMQVRADKAVRHADEKSVTVSCEWQWPQADCSLASTKGSSICLVSSAVGVQRLWGCSGRD